jgi:hypothetical protein
LREGMSSYPPDVEDFDVFDVRERPWDAALPDTRIHFDLGRAEFAASQLARAAAEQMAAIARVLDEARRHPEIYVVLDDEPTKRELEIAMDAAVADIAMRLSIAEGTVVALAHQADLLRTRAPQTWSAFREGEISAANARCVAATLDSLP